MTVEADNVATLRRAYQEWHDSKGAGTKFLEDFIHSDIAFASLANAAHEAVAFTIGRRGKEDYLSYIDGLTRDWEMIFSRFDDFIAQGDRVVAIGSTSWRNKNTGKSIVTPKVDIWRLRNGKAVEFSEFYDTAQLIAATQA